MVTIDRQDTLFICTFYYIVWCKNYSSSDQLVFICHSGSNRSVFYLYRVTGTGLESHLPIMCMCKHERGNSICTAMSLPCTGEMGSLSKREMAKL